MAIFNIYTRKYLANGTVTNTATENYISLWFAADL